ncbi:Tol-Pal system beta propeller repeat protein TolB [Chitiniphilus purpureus]|uniref:Tol-Pal system protein TolB n=1 Tax=Chitiniphilus purpureus TaxID=2981137 RepID=A0ABY6DMP3_9NEIS|nr:Tol-Pal system beta propeller repeat protein TolB [Chitiniphilus sp. CD1]UXY15640.1 Tol-Pal system beta propeller repeat protein TolB [Chitiniphilus sp. CD1]
MLERILKWMAVSLVAAAAAHADMTIEVVGVGANQYPIAIAPFQSEQGQQQPVTPIVGDDLARSGLFKVIGAGDLAPVPYAPEQLNHAALSGRGAQTALIGRVEPAADGSFSVKFWLVDLASRQVLLAHEKLAKPAQMRRVAHQIADMVYEKITGEPGAFSSRIAYVLKQGKRYQLQVADADGYGAQTVVASNEPIMSPKWSRDGGRLAYVSFEDKKPIVYAQELSSGRRWRVAAFKGSNSAPAWSPDGSTLAVTLTREGGSQLFLVPVQGGTPRRLTQTGEINTEPFFTPDGSSILFTSDRGGTPQVYRMPVSGGQAERLTFSGSYNASPKISPDGKTLTFITQSGGFRVAVMDLASRQVQVLTDTSADDSPSFSPNGRMILYETEQGGRGVLHAVSRDGRVKQRLKVQAGDVRQPAWGPMVR